MSSSNIYQEIWTADQNQNGVPALLPSDTTTSRDGGYVVVNESKVFDEVEDHKVLSDVSIPDGKKLTYDLCEKLFDNYNLNVSNREDSLTSEEVAEVSDFIDAIKDTAPMKVARNFIDPNMTDQEWFDSIKEKWFTFFLGSKDRSGFEHVLVGEDTGKVGGYHFWYKYYLDDGKGTLNAKDTINYGGAMYGDDGRSVPDVVTLRFKWDAYDTPENANDDLVKRIGGFWVGCSPEGLMALGMARLAGGPTTAVINNAEYDIRLYADDTKRYINTFFPVFKRSVGNSGGTDEGDDGSGGGETPPIVTPDDGTPSPTCGSVRIIAALINPQGHDAGSETVTVINISNAPVVMKGWSIVDKNGNGSGMEITQLNAGEVQTITLSGAPRTAQLGNKGGSIALVDGNGSVVHDVSYTMSQAKNQGFTTLF